MRPTSILARGLAAAGAVGLLAAAAPLAVTDGAATDRGLAGLDRVELDDQGLARVIVRFDGDVLPAGTLAAMEALGVTRGVEVASIGAVAVTAPPAVIAQVAELDGVRHVRPQRKLTMSLHASRDQVNALSFGTTPSTGLDGTSYPGVDADYGDVVVAIVDSGVAIGHPDTANVTLGYHATSFGVGEPTIEAGIFTAEQYDVYATSSGAIALQDEIGHGTHVASTVGGTGELAALQGADLNLQGVAPGVQFHSYKVATAPFGIVEDIDWEEAILFSYDFMIRNHETLQTDVTNNSWGLLPTEPNCLGACEDLGERTDVDAVKQIVDALADKGVTNVMSAGNSGPGDTIGDWVGEQSIVVAAACKAVPESGTLNRSCADVEEEYGFTGITDFSSRGNADGSYPQVTVSAPGDTIMAALSPSILAPLSECDDTQVPGYFCISGTSMSSPHVAGVAALMEHATGGAVTPAQTRDCMVSTAVDMVGDYVDSDGNEISMGVGFDIHSGAGMVDAVAAVACAVAVTS